MNRQEFLATTVIFIVVVAFNIHPMLIIPVILLGFIYLMFTALDDNPSMFTNLFQPDDKDKRILESVRTLKPTPATNPLTDTMFISAAEKAKYMKSIKWHSLKQQRLAIANYQCESCSSAKQLELHHVTYQRLTVENLEDIRIQCNSCHNKVHNELGYDRQTYYPIKPKD